MGLNYYAPRSCYEFVKDDAGRDTKKTGDLSSYRDCPAYVLLGQPGSGKTTTFEQEATQPNCRYVTARDFITFDIKPEWHNKTLFIDGLDEVRAGRDDIFSPFDAIRNKLDQLERPRFRLSCREADWYGASDREELEKVSPNGTVNQLFLADLEDEDMLQVLVNNYHKTESDASSFLEEAGRRELMDLIKNPQILEMLVVAVGEGNEWPERKVDIFRLACEKLLLEEWNQTHNIANRNQIPSAEGLMQAAGMLCAVMLLARKQGFASIQPNADEDYPFIADMVDDDPGLLQLVAGTRLFTTHDGQTEYSHRIFAEYLSAYYLSNKIVNGGLPVGRVLALMTGDDGRVVSELRGIYAWVATLCHTERDRLIQRDPLGVVLYGDVSLYRKGDRLKLLHELSEQSASTATVDPKELQVPPNVALCQPDMVPELRAILQSTDSSERHRYLLHYVLESMSHGKPLPELSDTLASLLKGSDCWLRTRMQALEELIRFDDEQVLLAILTDIKQNVIPDSDGALLGILLRSLYPHLITPSELCEYLRPHTNCHPEYSEFWRFDLDNHTNASHAAELLDSLVQRQALLNHSLDDFDCREMIGRLLVRGLGMFDNEMGVERLSGWLGLGLDEDGSSSLSEREHVEYIRKWLEQHPEIQKNLVEHCLDKCSREENFDLCTHKIAALLSYADLPEDYGSWCLDKARTSDDENIRSYFFTQSISTLVTGRGNNGMSLELVENTVAETNRLQRYWDEHRVREIKPEYSQHKLARKRRRDRQDQDRQVFLQTVRSNLRDIEAGTANYEIFKVLGSVYYGYFIDSQGDTPLDRLKHFLKGDTELIHSVLKGLRCFIDREDIPEMAEIFRAHMENKYFVYSRPYRAGMDALAENVLQLDGDKFEKALAFYYTDGTDEEPVWYKTLVAERPEMAAKVYTMFGVMALRAGKSHIAGSYQLAFDENHRQVARFAVLPLLERFRTRSTSEQLAPLYDLLAAALQHADHNRLKELTEKKLSLKSMDAAQRTLWLAAGFILDSNLYDRRLIEFVSGKEARINYLSGFLSYRKHQWSPLSDMSLPASVSLIRLLGPYCSPCVITDHDMRISSSDSSELIAELITRLAIFPTGEATGEIEALLQSDQLSTWHPQLKTTLHEQCLRKREAMFQFASLEKVLDTLNNGPPANAADLACITHARIRELAERIKYGNTNDFRQYWEKYPEKRQHEETCRDRFLSDLRPLLENMQIDAQPEGRYAAEGRADIRVSFGGYNLPIEIKCNDSQDLWHGIRKQLIERYTIDPGAHGYGIYLVLWFKYEDTPPHPESGPKPGTPAELEERLNQRLRNDEERKKISVCVVDCTADG